MSAARHDRLMRPPATLTHDEDEKIAATHAAGTGVRALAQHYGVSRGTIRRAINRGAARLLRESVLVDVGDLGQWDAEPVDHAQEGRRLHVGIAALETPVALFAGTVRNQDRVQRHYLAEHDLLLDVARDALTAREAEACSN